MKKLSLLCKSAILVIALLAITISPVLVKATPAPKPIHITQIRSCDSSGNLKDSFSPGEDVYCTMHISQGDPGQTLTDMRIYIVYDNEWMEVGGVIPPLTDRSDGYETKSLYIDSTNSSLIPMWTDPILIWSHIPTPLVPGQYDIVLDENHNGQRDPSEHVDDSDGLVVGFFVVPELPLGTLMAIMASMAAIGLTKNRSKAKQ